MATVWEVRPDNIAAQSIVQPTRTPSWYGAFRKWSGGATSGTIVLSDGGACVAVHHWVQPWYDPPIIPTIFPSSVPAIVQSWVTPRPWIVAT